MITIIEAVIYIGIAILFTFVGTSLYWISKEEK